MRDLGTLSGLGLRLHNSPAVVVVVADHSSMGLLLPMPIRLHSIQLGLVVVGTKVDSLGPAVVVDGEGIPLEGSVAVADRGCCSSFHVSPLTHSSSISAVYSALSTGPSLFDL